MKATLTLHCLCRHKNIKVQVSDTTMMPWKSCAGTQKPKQILEQILKDIEPCIREKMNKA